jgi:signal transduction histidine kinase
MNIPAKTQRAFADLPQAEIVALRQRVRLLEQQGALLQMTLDHLADGILALDEDWLIVASNDGFDRLLDLPLDLVLTGTSFSEVLGWLARRGDYGPGDPNRIAAGLIAVMERRADWHDEREAGHGRVIRWRVGEMPGRGRIVTISAPSASDSAARRDAGRRPAWDRGMTAPARRFGWPAAPTGDLDRVLRPVLALTELAMVDVTADGDGRAEPERAVAVAEHARAAVRSLLDFNRARREDGAETDVQDSVIRAVDLIKETIEPAIVVRLDLDRQDLRVALGPTEIQQIVMNLMLNAAQAISHTSGTIVIQTARVEDNDPRFRASPGYVPTRSYIRLSVIDDGPGIPEEVLPRIFEPFFTTRQAERASGLGLAVAHGLVTQAGGWIDVIGLSGARFDVLLPTIERRPGEER